jgi:hypothetical protein
MIIRSTLRATALIAAITVSAAAAQAQSPIKLGIAGGVTLPMDDTKDAVSTGYNGTVTVAFNAPLIPIGLRVDGMFNELQGKELLGGTAKGPKLSVSAVNANVTFNLLPLPIARVYAIGGVGYYRSEVKGFDSENDIGYNAGIGARLGIGSMQPFVEARYHRVNTGDDTHIDFIPVTIGFLF